MMPEALVFKGDDGPGELFGDGICGREAPLPVGGDAGAQQAAVAALEHGADRVVEQLARAARPHQEDKQERYAQQEQKILFVSHPFFVYLQ